MASENTEKPIVFFNVFGLPGPTGLGRVRPEAPRTRVAITIKSPAKDLSLPKLEITIAHKTFIGNSGSSATGPRPDAGRHRPASMDSDSGAPGRGPTDGGFAVLAFRLAAFTGHPDEVFLSC